MVVAASAGADPPPHRSAQEAEGRLQSDQAVLGDLVFLQDDAGQGSSSRTDYSRRESASRRADRGGAGGNRRRPGDRRRRRGRTLRAPRAGTLPTASRRRPPSGPREWSSRSCTSASGRGGARPRRRSALPPRPGCAGPRTSRSQGRRRREEPRGEALVSPPPSQGDPSQGDPSQGDPSQRDPLFEEAPSHGCDRTGSVGPSWATTTTPTTPTTKRRVQCRTSRSRTWVSA